MASNHRADTVRIWFNCFGVLDMGDAVRKAGYYWAKWPDGDWDIMWWSGHMFHYGDSYGYDEEEFEQIDERRIEREQ